MGCSKATGFPFKAEFDHVGFWDLRVAVAEKYQVGRIFIAGRRPRTAIRPMGVRAQQRPGGTRSISAGSSPRRSTVGAATRCCNRTARSGGRSSRRSPRISSPRASRTTASSSIATIRRATGRVRAGVESAVSGVEQPRRSTGRQHERLAGGSFGPPGGVSTAHGKTCSRRAPGITWRRSCCRRAATCSRNWARASRCSRSTWMTGGAGVRSEASRVAGAALKVVRDSYADGRTKYETRMILVRPDQFIVWIGDSAPVDAGQIMRKVAGRE